MAKDESVKQRYKMINNEIKAHEIQKYLSERNNVAENSLKPLYFIERRKGPLDKPRLIVLQPIDDGKNVIKKTQIVDDANGSDCLDVEKQIPFEILKRKLPPCEEKPRAIYNRDIIKRSKKKIKIERILKSDEKQDGTNASQMTVKESSYLDNEVVEVGNEVEIGGRTCEVGSEFDYDETATLQTNSLLRKINRCDSGHKSMDIGTDVYYDNDIQHSFTNPPIAKSKVLHINTKSSFPKSEAVIPLFTVPIQRCFVTAGEFYKITTSFKSNAKMNSIPHTQNKMEPVYESTPRIQEKLEIVHKKNDKAIDYDKMNRITKSYEEHFQRLKATIESLEKEVTVSRNKIDTLKLQLAEARKMTRARAFEVLTKNMSEDAKMLLRMQVEQFRKKARARRFSLKEKLFALALYKCSKQAYKYLSTILAMPNTGTLDKFLNSAHDKLLQEDASADLEHSVEGAANVQTESVEIDAEETMTDEQEEHVIDDIIITQEPIEGYSNVDNYVETFVHNDIRNYIQFAPLDQDVCYETDVFDKSQHDEILSYDTQYIDTSFNQDVANQWPVEVPKSVIVKKDKVKPDKSKSNNFEPTMSELKKNKIDFILSKMMAPEELQKFTHFTRKIKRVIPKNENVKMTDSNNITKTRNVFRTTTTEPMRIVCNNNETAESTEHINTTTSGVDINQKSLLITSNTNVRNSNTSVNDISNKSKRIPGIFSINSEDAARSINGLELFKLGSRVKHPTLNPKMTRFTTNLNRNVSVDNESVLRPQKGLDMPDLTTDSPKNIIKTHLRK